MSVHPNFCCRESRLTTAPDDNRARVVEGNYLARIVFLLGDDSTLAFVIPVLYNICVDYGESRGIVLGLQFSVNFADNCEQNPHSSKPVRRT